MTPLMLAAIVHRSAMARLLLEAGADPALVDKYGCTALRHAGDIANSGTETADLIKTFTR